MKSASSDPSSDKRSDDDDDIEEEKVHLNTEISMQKHVTCLLLLVCNCQNVPLTLSDNDASEDIEQTRQSGQGGSKGGGRR